MVFFDGRRSRTAGLAGLAALGVLALAGCSSAGGGSADGASPSVGTSVRVPSPTPATATLAVTAAPSAPAAAARPTDPCSVLTNAQVSAAMGGTSPLLAEGPSKDQPWACTWGSRRSYVALRSVDDVSFAQLTTNPVLRAAPVPGIGDSAVLLTRAENGSQPELLFTLGTAHYGIEAVADRSETGAVNAPAESAAEQALARLAAANLHG
ncbi:hypothetical protein GCM10010441_03080 [Kitasatospora paracochleata]|uniref:DUF3558 domain-containing protein n=1 Tax=Kitasatospora paracochleata TaxID=58354 RepID=A0ABT1J2B2_9ACTN|nr:DUF3558 family protein [Kitasatospora paracochleata]MCP2311575.1 hypothetical protein [Kitasatospora paracochleata]